MDKTEKLGDRIKKLRKAKKLTQPQLAQKVGRNPHTIKDYEAGRATPPWDISKKIANALGISHAELMDHERPAPDVKEVVSFHRVLDMYRNIPEDIVKSLAHFGKDSDVWDMIRDAIDVELTDAAETAKAGKIG